VKRKRGKTKVLGCLGASRDDSGALIYSVDLCGMFKNLLKVPSQKKGEIGFPASSVYHDHRRKSVCKILEMRF
jgi:hypothetical protein